MAPSGDDYFSESIDASPYQPDLGLISPAISASVSVHSRSTGRLSSPVDSESLASARLQGVEWDSVRPSDEDHSNVHDYGGGSLVSNDSHTGAVSQQSSDMDDQTYLPSHT